MVARPLALSSFLATVAITGCDDEAARGELHSDGGPDSIVTGHDPADGGDECGIDAGGCNALEVEACSDKKGTQSTCTKPATLDLAGLRPDAPPFGIHGPYWVGHHTFDVASSRGNRSLAIRSWYPAFNPTLVKEEITYDVTQKVPDWKQLTPAIIHGHAILDARIDDTKGPYPLIVFSHGYALSPAWYANLVEHYASHGFIVLAPEHDESDWLGAADAAFDRPLDIVQTLDFAEVLTAPTGNMAQLIDLAKVAMVGHSFGGYTALAMGGARFDLGPFTARCNALAAEDPKSFLCAPFLGQESRMAARAGLGSVPVGPWPSLHDARIKAIIPLAGDAYLFNEVGLSSITVPMMAIGGTLDFATPWEWGAQLAYGFAASERKALVGFEGANHMIAMTPCEQVPWSDSLPPLHRDMICFDPIWSKPRTIDLINHYSTAFLLDVLKEDKAAHQALLPDTMAPPGITYTSTMR